MQKADGGKIMNPNIRSVLVSDLGVQRYRDFMLGALAEEDRIISGFKMFFRINVVISAFSSFISVLSLFSALNNGGTIFSVVGLVLVAFSWGMFFWFFSLCARWVGNRQRKIRGEIEFEARYREDSMKKQEDILDAARSAARDIITVNGPNSFVITGSNKGNITYNFSGSSADADAIATLLAYAEASGERAAKELAQGIASEATSEKPNKSAIFQYWTDLVGILPGIKSALEVVKLVGGLLS